MNRRGSSCVTDAVRRIALHTSEALERRVLFASLAAEALGPADMSETEPNDSAATANVVPIGATPTVVEGMVGGGSDASDFFTFTLAERSGVFIDVDAIEAGIATTLDSFLELYDATGTTKLAESDDGRDFDTLLLNDNSHTPLVFGDSAFYMDLAAGTYVLRMTTFPSNHEPYQLKFTASPLYTTTVPEFSSLPGAPHTLYLDFDSHAATDAWNGGAPYTIPAFDLNGDASEWTPGERLAIENTFRVVADAFSPFNVNVTTSYAGGYTPDATAFRVVIGNSTGSEVGQTGNPPGAAFLDSYNSLGETFKTGFVFAQNFSDPDAGASGRIVANAIEIGNAAAETFGRALGLLRYGGTNAQPNAFMQRPDVGFNRERWVSGNTSNAAGEPAVVFQNDLNVITKAANQITFRVDDHGNTQPTATVLTASGNGYSGSGVIHQTSDVDVFRFAGSGATTVTLAIPEHLGRLDGEIRLFDAVGTLLATSDVADRLGGTITINLPAAGDYFVQVSSDGGPGEIGQYGVNISTTVPPTGGSIAGRVFRDADYDNSFDAAEGDVGLSTTVYIDGNDNGSFDGGETFVTSSAADGTYAFADVPVGTHRIRQSVPGGYASDREWQVVITAAGENVVDRNFGNFPIAYSGSSGNETFTLRVQSGDASRIEILQSGDAATYSAPKALITSLTFDGDAGDDTFVLDYTNGLPVPTLGATFNAGSGADDRITVTGSASADVVAFGVGTISHDGDGTLSYSSDVDQIVVNANGGDDGFSGGTGAGGPSLTVNGDAGEDSLLVTLPTPGLVFNGGSNAAESDSLTFGAGAGDYTFSSDLAGGTAALILAMSNPGGSLTFGATQHLKQLTVTDGTVTMADSGSRVLAVDTLGISSGRLDLKDNDMIVHAGVLGASNGSTYDGIQGLIASAYNGGNWSGSGITTTTAAALGGSTMLGAAPAGTVLNMGAGETKLWNGETVSASAVLVKYTYPGDANLDGFVSGDDYTAIDFAIAAPNAHSWLNGDFNYDGIISGDDYTVIDFAIAAQGAPL